MYIHNRIFWTRFWGCPPPRTTAHESFPTSQDTCPWHKCASFIHLFNKCTWSRAHGPIALIIKRHTACTVQSHKEVHMFKVIYLLNGVEEYSTFSSDMFSPLEARRELLDSMPMIKILRTEWLWSYQWSWCCYLGWEYRKLMIITKDRESRFN